jgi:hypothetical protein
MFFKCILADFLGLIILVTSQNVELKFEDSIIIGTKMQTRDDKDFYAFRGIHYAEAPIGDLRFQV